VLRGIAWSVDSSTGIGFSFSFAGTAKQHDDSTEKK